MSLHSLFPRLAALGMPATLERRPLLDEAGSGEAFDVSAELRQREEHIHEDQLREPGSCSRVGGHADKALCIEDVDAIVQGNVHRTG